MHKPASHLPVWQAYLISSDCMSAQTCFQLTHCHTYKKRSKPNLEDTQKRCYSLLITMRSLDINRELCQLLAGVNRYY